MDDPAHPPPIEAAGLRILRLPHPQGCQAYLVLDPESRQALALDVHLDGVAEAASRLAAEAYELRWIVDTHTHADHPSGARSLEDWFGGTRVAHREAGHRGVSMHPEDGEPLALGERSLRVLHAPGHTPDHIVLTSEAALFSGDSLFIDGVARTDFLGGDAGTLYDTIQRLLAEVPEDARLFPGHVYGPRTESTLGRERKENPWLALPDRATFARRLVEHPPPRPANMDALLAWNKGGVDFPARAPARQVADLVRDGGAASVIDVRSDVEVDLERIPGAHHIPFEELEARADEVRATPAPRYLICGEGLRSSKAQQALDVLGVRALIVTEGGIPAYREAGGALEQPGGGLGPARQAALVEALLAGAGAGLALLHPAFLGLAAVAVLGLLARALLDRDPVEALLLRAPWNAKAAAARAAAGGGCAAHLPPPPACAAEAKDAS